MKHMKHAGGRIVGRTNPSKGFEIQPVLVPKDKFSRGEAVKYIKEHRGFIHLGNSIRLLISIH